MRDPIEAWRNQLPLLAEAATPVPPPSVWERLEASLGLPPAVAPQLAAAVGSRNSPVSLSISGATSGSGGS
jgi:hypothetical protein